MCFRFAKKYKIGLIKEILGVYGIDGGNQIGSSSLRVAKGWWLLWNKYEKDVLNLCGKDVIVDHYKDTFKRFLCTKDAEYLELNKKKLLEFISPKEFNDFYNQCTIKDGCLKKILKKILHLK